MAGADKILITVRKHSQKMKHGFLKDQSQSLRQFRLEHCREAGPARLGHSLALTLAARQAAVPPATVSINPSRHEARTIFLSRLGLGYQVSAIEDIHHPLLTSFEHSTTCTRAICS
jgi:hypothetical protein